MDSIRIEIRVLLVAVSAILAIEIPAYFIAQNLPFSPLVWVGISRLFEIALMLWIVSAYGSGVFTIGLHPSIMVSGFKSGIVWSLGFGLLAGVVSLILVLSGVNPIAWFRGSLPIHTVDILWLFIVGGVISPVAEEIFFRGILYGCLRRWGVVAAVLLSTLIFSVFHAPTGLSAQQVIGGILFAVIYEKEKNLMAPIIVHMAANMAIFALSFMQ